MDKELKSKKIMRFILLLFVGLTLAFNAFAQQHVVKGVVKDGGGEPVIGASVVAKGTTNGVITDLDGQFTLGNVNLNTTIVISYLGYTSKEIIYTGQKELNVVLSEDAELLDEVVVIGYGQVRKGDATGALTSVKADATTRGFAPNAQDMLVGKVAGVNITSGGGSPSAGATIRIRGGSSLSASNDPLLIVDGVPIDNGLIGGVGNLLSTINPTDIETFTVLKDASATAIYGSRASNGVILITTKKGTAGKVRINYDGNISISTRKKDIDVMNGDEFRDFIHKTFQGASNYEEVVSKLGTANTDWQDEIFRTSVSTEHNLSAYGSVKDYLPYRVSFGYTNLNGILKTSNMERYTAGVSLTPSLFDKHLNININGKGMYIKNRFAPHGAIGSAFAMDPSQPVYVEDSPYGGYYTWLGVNGALLGVATKNPVAQLNMRNDKSKVYNFIGNAQFDYKLHFLPDLKFNLNLGLDYSESEGSNYISEFSPVEFQNGGLDANWEQRRRNTLMDFYTQYSKELGFLDSRFDVMGGYSWQHYWRSGNNHDYRIAKFDEYGNPQVAGIDSYENEYYLISFFGRLNYSVLDRYLLTFTLRNDGSSRFHKDNRWGLFPSVALAWRAINEDFLKDSNVVSDMKLRLGWGITGQQDINAGDYPYMGRYENSVGEQASYLRGYDNGIPRWWSLIRPSAFNPNLKWETTTTYNVGVDYGFFKNRVYGSIDFYQRKTKDLINAEARVAAGSNFKEFVAANVGSLKNTGVEFSTNVHAIQTKDLSWEIGGNFAYNKNKITSLSYGANKNTMRRYGSTGGDGSFNLLVHSVDNPSGMYYVYEQIYDENGKPIEGLYVDRDNDGQITENDLHIYKKPTPDWVLGLNTKLTWKAWDFSIAGHGSIGNYNYNGVAANNAELSTARVYANEFLSNRPKSAFETNFQTKTLLSDYYIQNASFFRIDNITLGWSFKKSNRIPLSGRIYSTVQNPFVFTKYDGLDPEIEGGIDNEFYPRPLTIMMGVNINF